jgi:hypothetical protein
MPERWERELEKLNELDAPVSTRSRIDEGPHGEGVPPPPGRSQRIVAGVVAFAVFGGALAFALGAFGSNGEPGDVGLSSQDPVVFTFFVSGVDGNDETFPDATMQVGDRLLVPGNGSSYGWEVDGGGLIADTFGSEFDFEEWVEVPAGAPIVIRGDAVRVRGQVDDCCGGPPPPILYRLDLDAGAVIPDEVGRYVLEFTAEWQQGNRTFFFPVRVVPAPATPTPSPDIGPLPPDASSRRSERPKMARCPD